MLDSIFNLFEIKRYLLLETYFPKSHKFFQDNNKLHDNLFSKKIIHGELEEKNYLKYIKNLDLEVFIVKSKEPDAYTWTGIDNIDILKHAPINFQLKGYEVLSKHPLTATLDKNNNIVFNSGIKNFKVLMFITSGLISKIDNPDYRFAIALHEIGHWVNITPIIQSKNFEKYLRIVQNSTNAAAILSGLHLMNNSQYKPFLLTLLYIIQIVLYSIVNFKNRESEYKADEFVKRMGRGKELQNSLSLLYYNKEYPDINVNTFFNKFCSVMDTILIFFPNIQTHPHVNKRLVALEEGIGFDDLKSKLMDLVDILNPLDKLISDNM